MGILVEHVDLDSIESQILSENTNGQIQKNYYITGKFLCADMKNGNGRIYPRPVIEKEVLRVNKNDIPYNRFVGELN